MNITEYIDKDNAPLEAFKAHVWPLADKEHYGENQPVFSDISRTYLARKDNQIIGYVSVRIDSGVAQIEPLMVHPDYQGQGIGSALLAHAEQIAHSLGAHKIWLETGNHWRSKRFYEKQGYSVRTLLPNHTGGGDFVLLDKML